jgi:hypothetical protein
MDYLNQSLEENQHSPVDGENKVVNIQTARDWVLGLDNTTKRAIECAEQILLATTNGEESAIDDYFIREVD